MVPVPARRSDTGSRARGANSRPGEQRSAACRIAGKLRGKVRVRINHGRTG